ncbi:hypothetical protein BU15DRAFT_66204 [Melanogaster broomeanus]|nr:hypothetical protein BU15DRAFT_66204 [Melanogaster broomeanus]
MQRNRRLALRDDDIQTHSFISHDTGILARTNFWLGIMSQTGPVVDVRDPAPAECGCSKELFEVVKGERSSFSSTSNTLQLLMMVEARCRTTDDGILSFPLARHIIKLTTRNHKGFVRRLGKREWTATTEDPVLLCATTIHPSSIPSTVPSTGGDVAAVTRGAEIVGQAEMLTMFSKPFKQVGLLGHGAAQHHGSVPETIVTQLPDLNVRSAEKQKARSNKRGPASLSSPYKTIAEQSRREYAPCFHNVIDDGNRIILLVALVLDVRGAGAEVS